VWTRLQGTHECYFVVADWHALTTGYRRTDDLRACVRDMVLDWYSAGIDPPKCCVFVQSDVPEHAELCLLLSTLTPIPWLERSTTYKEWMSHREVAQSAGLGLLAYPVLQAADILAYRANLVPVGKDQTQHVEITRDIAGRFNSMFGPVFPLPEALYSDFPALPGTDGRKMSKIYGNVIHLSDPEAAVERKIATMLTDPAKIYKGDPGRPDICPVFVYHNCYNIGSSPEIRAGCESGDLGCVECKAILTAALAEALSPIRRRRAELARDPDALLDILRDGARRASVVARDTLARVREAMGLWPRTNL
jgi:tryptophanyl-tRNA synthetase